jgi:hypothetical protein
MKQFIFTVAATLLLCATAQAQHLWWQLGGQKNATCLYGEITVLATAPHIYYCGANWHPGEPAGGYCGIQHNSDTERRTIFSIWDTSPELHPEVTAADARTVYSRFGGEGTGAHTHMLWPWNVGDTFQFFVRKQPGQGDTTDTRYYVYDRIQKSWLHSATISSPNGGKACVASIGGGLNSFLENFAGKDRAVPKLALYRLWLGPNVDAMKCLTRAGGDGTWGQLNGTYFLAEGDPAALNDLFGQLNQKGFGLPAMGEKGKRLEPIPDTPVPGEVIAALKKLPRASQVGGPSNSPQK